MTTSYIPISVNLSGPAPVGMSSTDYYTSGLAIQNQANSMLANGQSSSLANGFVTSALQDLTNNGTNSAYFTQGDPSQTNATSNTTSQSSWWKNLIPSSVSNILNTGGAGGNSLSKTVTGSDIFSGWDLSRVMTIVVGSLLLLGAIIMFAANKSNVTELVSTVAKNPELLA